MGVKHQLLYGTNLLPGFVQEIKRINLIDIPRNFAMGVVRIEFGHFGGRKWRRFQTVLFSHNNMLLRYPNFYERVPDFLTNAPDLSINVKLMAAF